MTNPPPTPTLRPLTTKTVREAAAYLSAADKTLGTVIAKVEILPMPKKEPPFHVLALSIMNQQISTYAAAAIQARVEKIVPAPFTPAALCQASAEQLRAAGLSYRKIEYVQELATRAQNGELPIDRFARMPDEEIITALTTARGVGRWTAEMFLMFALRRPDVVSLGDAALCRAARALYKKRWRGSDADVLRKASQRWHPYRTVACCYLWGSLRLTEEK